MLYLSLLRLMVFKQKGMKVVITGSSGLMGKGALLQCVKDSRVEEVLIINRKSIGFNHPKVKEILLTDMFELDSIKEELKGYDACFFSIGITAFRAKEEYYHKMTFGLTKLFADVLWQQNPDLTFLYISAEGSDPTESSGSFWKDARGKTENYIIHSGKKGYVFRLAVIKPIGEVSSRTYGAAEPVVKVLYPVLRCLAPNKVTTTENIGKSFLNIVEKGNDIKLLQSRAINALAAQ
ncbi:unnamed protein product [Dimorphilus gyrociliatus]|uniref:Uncharacterized protein n=1 Tax=Dimorphilus gyrociliatus TaxID=2664684 RepID=A0A7I8WE60_9ANNE|nr:unnamed protein product [Dimorphilus gyrociliatus]CAD5126936.1 unnamed protein product [Dimorphilus gyrociliatus]